ncbi:protein BREAST CANCER SUSCEPTIBILITY 1 homolog [Spinacia oleracea]|uniref:Protein BREAST CANCER SUSCEPTIBILITY 1 homolog n=1 Tax=Spinacia oleracea TaxID=3562 RepID=A0A9R0IM73_SPIOL|nr:protein BREAST CANCER SUSCEPTIBILITY 1 homolog [Spinacia oleracea]
MPDSSHLERMGRELKCPICLSLFDSSVSLTCNHVFCNACIHKSMKSGSNCPVCKVPYQRREIRPAPHMDNLVSIYKNMEVASGLTLFVSQNGPSTKLPPAEIQSNDDLDAMREAGEETPEMKKCQRREVTPVASKMKSKRSGRNRGKSSFATNKRVQVPESPITESPARQEKDGLGQKKVVINNLVNKCSTIPSVYQLSTDKERPHMSPFFWLREEVERSSIQTDEEQLTLTCTPVKAPSFSDLKDSDDDVPPQNPLEEEPHSKYNTDIFDSEMFEWTQRERSPELCPSPFKEQVEETDCDTASRDAAAIRKTNIEQLANVNPQENNSNLYNAPLNNAYPRRKSKGSRNKSKTTHKRGGKENKGSRRNNMENEKALGGPKAPSDFMQCQGFDTGILLKSSKAAGTYKTRQCQSLDVNLMNEVDGHVLAKLPAASGSKRKDKKLGNIKRKIDSIEHIYEGDSLKRKKQMKNLAQPDNIEEKSISLNEVSFEKPCRVIKGSHKCNASHKPKKIRQLTSVLEQKITENVNLRGKVADGGENVNSKVAGSAEDNGVCGKSNNDNSVNSLKNRKVHCQKQMPALRKCDTVSIKCAFCHSSEDTEASGEMVHYSEGRPVLANHTEGSVIHSHKNCTEWAPNVYFEDNTAVNLEEELMRSRRIKCSLCGVKGASLGCYEKSCRKSFHIPCAKKLKECRWDADHFVILCPLHTSLKLPCELPTSQIRRGKYKSKGKLPSQRPQSAVKHATSTNRWDCGRPFEKVVLCCSALSTVEKEAVSELAKSSGAVLLGSWDPSITHVIASTNENGACKRTLKVMMGILEGKWILSIKWVEACMAAKRLVEGTPYEITCDIHGVQNGPLLGRLRHLNEEAKLFVGFNFYLTVDFEPAYKGYLQDLITAAGGTVLHRKPIAETYGIVVSASSTVIVYSIEPPANCDLRKKDTILNCRRSDAEALAISSGAKLANNSWVLNCIAGHKLQDL